MDANDIGQLLASMDPISQFVFGIAISVVMMFCIGLPCIVVYLPIKALCEVLKEAAND